MLIAAVNATDAKVSLFVTDDGTGFSSERGNATRRTFGISGMESRAKLVGAELFINSSEEGGTEVKLEIPLFMDTIFTVAASCFGWICGIVAALSTHAVSFVAYGYALPEDLPNRIFVLCSLTMVAGVRLMLFQKTRRKAQAQSRFAC